MARIAGVNLQDRKHVWVALTGIYGIGRSTALKLCKELKIEAHTKLAELTEEQLEGLRQRIANYVVEGDLRRELMLAKKRLQEIGTVRGMRHRRGLPVRGQRTKTNARTRKGRRKSAA